jgi:RNA polymerase sigma-70 factor (ECF subfamily)
VDENRMIDGVLSGDPAAERAFYDIHVERVYRLAYRMAGETGLAEDFTQETFMRAFDRLATFRKEAALSSWVHSVAVSVILSGLRRVKRHRSREEQQEDFSTGPGSEPPPDHELRCLLTRAVDSLSDPLRLVFVMHDIEGYKHHEIAGILDIPVGTSKARLSRAHGILRRELGPRPARDEEEVEA